MGRLAPVGVPLAGDPPRLPREGRPGRSLHGCDVRPAPAEDEPEARPGLSPPVRKPEDPQLPALGAPGVLPVREGGGLPKDRPGRRVRSREGALLSTAPAVPRGRLPAPRSGHDALPPPPHPRRRRPVRGPSPERARASSVVRRRPPGAPPSGDGKGTKGAGHPVAFRAGRRAPPLAPGRDRRVCVPVALRRTCNADDDRALVRRGETNGRREVHPRISSDIPSRPR
jgi:hypothetical protein